MSEQQKWDIAAAQERILECAEEAPWKTLKAWHTDQQKDFGQTVVRQLRERICTQGKVVSQGWEGFCAAVSAEVVYVARKPSAFATTIADLVCTGTSSLIKTPKGHPIKASSEIYNCHQSANFGGPNQVGFYEHIPAVDWMWASTLSWSFNTFWGVCGVAQGQGQNPGDLVNYARALVPSKAEQVKLFGGVGRHVLRLAAVSVAHYHKRKVWNTVISEVENGAQAFITVKVDGGEMLDGFINGLPNDWKLLTEIITPEHANKECAKQLLEKTRACVVWSMHEYAVFEDCDNLRKQVGDIVLVPKGEEESGSSLRLLRFQQGSPWNEELMRYMVSMWKDRVTNRHGIWPGSQLSVPRKTYIPTYLRSDLKHDEQEVWTRTEQGGNPAIKLEGIYTTFTMDGKSGNKFYYYKVTHINKCWTASSKCPSRAFGTNFKFLGRVLLGKTHIDAGFPDETSADYGDCTALLPERK